MAVLFGTDGVRDVANHTLTPELAFKLGRAGAAILIGEKSNTRAKMVVGRDTRISGEMLLGALSAGITSVGVDVYDAGIIPTPAIAYLTRDLGADAGVMISASHNPVEYNGIKFFSRDGYKLPDEMEDKIEGIILDDRGRLKEGFDDGLPRPTGDALGRVIRFDDGEERYAEYIKGTVDIDLRGLKILLDCANGASYRIAPRVLSELGAEVITINNEPDGTNINFECGSTHPRAAQEGVVKHGADLGFTYDGDADRILVVNREGQIIDGDRIIAICGRHLLRRKRLKGGAVAATVYSNLGLIEAMENAGGSVVLTKAGDRYVIEAMREKGLNLGGEQSGHIIFLDYNTTGDGILTGLQLLAVLKESGKSLEELSGEMKTYPQIMINVRVKDKDALNRNDRVRESISKAEELMSPGGRIFVRPSGTEPLIRIMGEGPDPERLKSVVYDLAQVIREEMGEREDYPD